MKLLSIDSRPLVPLPRRSVEPSMSGRLVVVGAVKSGIGRGVGLLVGLGVTLRKKSYIV